MPREQEGPAMVDSNRRTGAGATAQAKYTELWAARRARRIATTAAIALAAALAAWWYAGFQAAVGVACMAAGAVTLYRARQHDDTAAWRKGAAGERRTARMLAPLESAGYVVLHDRALPRGRANIDHLVIGPPGVFVIDSKNWHRKTTIRRQDGRVWVGKRPLADVTKPLRYETQSVEEALDRALGRKVPTLALAAVHGSRLRETISMPGLVILRARRARRWICRLPQQLTANEVAEVAQWVDRLFPPKVG